MKKIDKSVILVVDDKPANLLSLESLLENKDRTFLNATNGKDALKIVLNKEIDLIILDVNMPEMDGFEVAQILKSNKRTRDIPIIFASAEKKEQKFMLRGYEEGAIDYLFKPLDPEVAKAKVAVFLKLQLQKKELLEKNSSLKKSALLINNSADIIAIIDAETFKIEEINNAFTSILGYTKEETKGTALTFLLGNEDRIFVQRLNKQQKERLSFETQIYCKDRSIKWLHWNIVVKQGKWFVNARDITEIKKVETIRNYLATVVKQSNDAIYIHDYEGKIISWNKGAEKVYVYTEDEALKMKIWNIIPDYIQPETNEIVEKIINGKKIENLETIRITKHGKLIDVLFSASIITNAGSDQKSIAITERDITQQKLVDEQVRQLNADLEKKVIERTEKLTASEKKLRELYEKLVKSDNEIRNFAKHLNQVVEDERSHIAREMHDEIGQQLAGMKINFVHLQTPENNAQVQKMLRNIDGLIQTLRKIATQLRPGILDSLGLIPSIEWLVKEFENKTKIKCRLMTYGVDVKYEKNISTCFFRICQESLTNISKHAQASEVTIETNRINRELLLKIIDNGKGIASEKLENPFSMGLLGMRERANLIGADLKITSNVGLGTTVQLTVKIN